MPVLAAQRNPRTAWCHSGPAMTNLGVTLARLPLHPRLGRMVLAGHEAGDLRSVALTAAMLAERDPFFGTAGIIGSRNENLSYASLASDIALRVGYIENSSRQAKARVRSAPSTEIRSTLSYKVLVIRATDWRRSNGEQRIDVGGQPFIESFGYSKYLRIARTISTRHRRNRDAIAPGRFPDRLAKRRSLGKNSALMVGGRAVQ